jgi:hypothetical protein
VKVVKRASETSPQKIIMGWGAGSSASSGDRMVKPLATSWQIPIAVALFSSGNKVGSLKLA